MNLDETHGARLARWWTHALTRTAEGSAARDRRAEIASDVHEQLTEAWHHDALREGSRSVIARVVRGMPSDIAWRVGLELRPGRFAWHVRNPSTAITTLLVVMLPVNWAADSNVVPLWALTHLLGLCILLLSALALATRVRPRWIVDAEKFQPLTRLERARRCATAGLGVALAGSAVLRFTALELIAGVFWAAFVVCLFAYAALLITTVGVKTLTLGRYLPKVTA